MKEKEIPEQYVKTVLDGENTAYDFLGQEKEENLLHYININQKIEIITLYETQALELEKLEQETTLQGLPELEKYLEKREWKHLNPPDYGEIENQLHQPTAEDYALDLHTNQ